MADDGFFSGIEQRTTKTTGGDCELPIFYRDGSVIGVMYRVDPALVPIGADDPFEPFTLMGKAIVQLVVFEYRDTSIGPYNEVALAVEIKRKGTSPSTLGALVNAKKQRDYGSYFLNLPVTTETACAAGREIWGFPKYVVDIETAFQPDGMRAVQGGEFELRVGAPSWLHTPGIPFVLMSTKDGHVLRTIVETRHKLIWGGASTVKLSITGDGPTADNMARMRLDTTTPSFVWRSDAMRSILPAGEDLGPV